MERLGMMYHPSEVEAYTFEDLVAYEMRNADVDAGSFTFRGARVTRIFEECYHVVTFKECMRLGRNDVLIIGLTGKLCVLPSSTFETLYTRVD